jgi:hypothetical protein
MNFRKPNKSGRSGHVGKHVQLPEFMLASPAWRSLNPAARVLYVELRRIYNGKNNGFLALSVRDAAERCAVNKDTASKAFAALIDRGFIDLATPASFGTNGRHAAEYRLTDWPCNRTNQRPSKAFMAWVENAEARPKRGDKPVRNEGTQSQPGAVCVPLNRTQRAA